MDATEEFFLADGHIDAYQVFTFLVDYGVYGDGGFACLAVAYNELPLPAPDRHHSINSLNARLKRHINLTPSDDPRRNPLYFTGFGALDRTFLVYWLP
jgi:hypothetical protein